MTPKYQTRYVERRFSHLAGQGTEPSAARRKVFRDRRTTKGILLDSRGAFRAGRRQRGFGLLPRRRKPKSDSPDAGSFYNKAPRFSVFQGDSYSCEAIK